MPSLNNKSPFYIVRENGVSLELPPITVCYESFIWQGKRVLSDRERRSIEQLLCAGHLNAGKPHSFNLVNGRRARQVTIEQYCS